MAGGAGGLVESWTKADKIAGDALGWPPDRIEQVLAGEEGLVFGLVQIGRREGECLAVSQRPRARAPEVDANRAIEQPIALGVGDQLGLRGFGKGRAEADCQCRGKHNGAAANSGPH